MEVLGDVFSKLSTTPSSPAETLNTRAFISRCISLATSKQSDSSSAVGGVDAWEEHDHPIEIGDETEGQAGNRDMEHSGQHKPVAVSSACSGKGKDQHQNDQTLGMEKMLHSDHCFVGQSSSGSDYSGRDDFTEGEDEDEDIRQDDHCYGLAYGNDMNARFHEACATGDVTMVMRLLSHGSDPNVYSADGNTPLHVACQHGQLEIFEALLGWNKDSSTKYRCDLNQRDYDDRTCLHIAADNGSTEILNTMLQLKPKPELEVYDLEGATPLILAAAKGHCDIVELLIQHGCDLEECNNEHRTALMEAVASRQRGVVDILLKRGCEVNVRDQHGNSALHDVVLMNDLTCLHQLVSGGACVNIQDCRGRTSLHNAVVQGFSDIAAALIDAGTSIDIQDSDGFTPLFMAAWDPWNRNTHSILVKLAESNANLDLPDNTDVQPIAKAWHIKKHVHTLIQYGCEVNTPMVIGSSKYYLPELAAMENDFDMVTLLLQAGFQTKLLDFSKNRNKEKHKDAFRNLEAYCSVPLKLMDYCRLQIRGSLRKNSIAKIDCLPLPSLLKRYLILRQY